MIILENEHISATFTRKGAELQSLKNKKTNIDYLWNGDHKYWGKFSPILFPIVGGLKQNTYKFENQEYTLPRHGFARDHEFELERVSEEELLFSLFPTEESMKVYPFQFRLDLRYRISENSISCSYEVSNTDQKNLLFSIGGHPAFAVPNQSQLGYEDYFLEFNNDTALTYHKISQDLIADETETIILEDKRLPLRHELFYGDALVFKQLKSNHIAIRNTQTAVGLDFYFENFPFFGIWAAKDADFVCLEPWCGIADGVHHNQQLEDKEGIVTLAPQSTFKRRWRATCY